MFSPRARDQALLERLEEDYGRGADPDAVLPPLIDAAQRLNDWDAAVRCVEDFFWRHPAHPIAADLRAAVRVAAGRSAPPDRRPVVPAPGPNPLARMFEALSRSIESKAFDRLAGRSFAECIEYFGRTVSGYERGIPPPPDHAGLEANWERINREVLTPVSLPDPEVLHDPIEVCRRIGAGVPFDISPPGAIGRLAEPDDPPLLAMSHGCSPWDTVMIHGVLALWLEHRRAAGRPNDEQARFVINRVLTDAMPPRLRRAYVETVGIPVASPFIPNAATSAFNKEAMAPHLDALASGRTCLAIFPEGARNGMPLEDAVRYQRGVGRIVRTVLERRGRLRVVPLGAAWRNGRGLVHVGAAIDFELPTAPDARAIARSIAERIAACRRVAEEKA